jgi:hypothetical protein
MPAFSKTGGSSKKVPGEEMAGAPDKPGRQSSMMVGGDQGGVKMGAGASNGEKKVPAPEIKGRHLT